MKTFLQYLSETQKVYEYRIRFANVDPKEHMDCINAVLAAYVAETVSSPKHLPIMENNIYFPSIKNAEVYVMEVALKYPVNDMQLRLLIAESIGAPLNQIFVIPCNHPEELWRQQEGELKQFVKGDSELQKPYPDVNEAQRAASDSHSMAGVLVKDTERTAKIEISGTDRSIAGERNPADAHTLNGIASGKQSPMGSNQNTIPNPNKGLKR
jgi:hypothetical protein